MIPIHLLQFNSTLSASFEEVLRDSNAFLERINPEGKLKFGEEGLPVFFIRTGGSEEWFLKAYQDFKEPYFILAQGERNSLAASLEIVSFLHQKGKKAILLYGDEKGIAKNLLLYGQAYQALERLKNERFGVIGTPSDWLIASSNLDYEAAKARYGLTLVDIPIEEMYGYIDEKKLDGDTNPDDFHVKGERKQDLLVSLYIHYAIKKVLEKHDLDGFTLRCFALLEKYQNTSCLSFALHNDVGKVAACEGDVPALISMAVLNALLEEPIFMANPARIDVAGRQGVYAHCTCPFKMLHDVELHTHFESGQGFGIRGKFENRDITMFKIDPSLDAYVIKEGKILDSLSENNLCRTQIVVAFDEPIDDLISSPCGNHMLFVYGRHKEELEAFLSLRG